ncbi:hypothetical protein NE237_033043 [Protea cynaroides]|uniref:Uncharacterized protein n=1 Tax=Protea cynaroides TaxID=273540 RepID=A0A9Q0L611_9MAGN|nr:hypothetical protein NE237_033043 [Protea cynaroides]
MLGPVILNGPCKTPSIEFQVQGLVQAPPDPASFKTDGWIAFYLTVFNEGTFDGQGQKAWTINNCAANPHNCRMPPISLRFNFVNNTTIRDITSLNSKNFRINIFQSNDLTLKNLNILAPGDSANIDGIHIGDSARIHITDIVIATGDDCISIGPGTRNVNVTRVICGPGHDISVGSLGMYKGEAEVNGVFVRNNTFVNTQNGVRIKTWPSSPVGIASDIVFEDLILNNVFNPIILDQGYCPHLKCTKHNPSLVKLSNIKIYKIRGTSLSQLAVVIGCSRGAPCENVKIGNINLKYNGIEGPAQSTCSNVKPILFSLQIPPCINI